MDIKELKSKHETLEEEISLALNKFVEETDCKIIYIHISELRGWNPVGLESPSINAQIVVKL